MKHPALSLLLASVAATANPDIGRTVPSGYSRVTVAANSQGTVSAPLRHKAEFAGAITINNDWSSGSQTVTVSGANWTSGQWSASSSPHLLGVIDGDGAEESFLITANTGDTLTIAAGYDLLLRISSSTTGAIRPAHTLAGLLGTPTTTSLSTSDNAYLWSGLSWVRYHHDGTTWKGSGFGDKSNTVVFPDEGMFVERNESTDVTLTFVGQIPDKPQVSNVPGAGMHYVSVRYPVATTVSDLGLQNLSNWVTGSSSTADAFFVWNGTWTRYYVNSTLGYWVSGGFGNKNDEVIPPDTAIFVQRVNANPPEDSSNVHILPYTP